MAPQECTAVVENDRRARAERRSGVLFLEESQF